MGDRRGRWGSALRGVLVMAVVAATWGWPTMPAQAGAAGGGDPAAGGQPAGGDAPTPVEEALGWTGLLPDGSADIVVLGRADDFADALASGGLQGALEAPLLLTPGDALDDGVARELDRLGTEHVILLGGRAAIGSAVESTLRERGHEVERVEGETRIDTAVAIAERGFDRPRTVLLARGFGDPAVPSRAFADALGGASLAAAMPAPLLVTASEQLSDAVTTYLRGTPSVQEVLVIGGEAAIGSGVVDALVAEGLSVRRVHGPERFTTAARLSAAEAALPGPAGRVVVVDGTHDDAWAAAFAGARHADPLDGGGVLLVQGEVVPAPTQARLALARGGHPVVACAGHVVTSTCAAVSQQHRDMATAVHPSLTAALSSTDPSTSALVVARSGQDGVCVEGHGLAPGAVALLADVTEDEEPPQRVADVLAGGIIAECGVTPLPQVQDGVTTAPGATPVPVHRPADPRDVTLMAVDDDGAVLQRGGWGGHGSWAVDLRLTGPDGHPAGHGVLLHSPIPEVRSGSVCVGVVVDDAAVSVSGARVEEASGGVELVLRTSSPGSIVHMCQVTDHFEEREQLGAVSVQADPGPLAVVVVDPPSG